MEFSGSTPTLFVPISQHFANPAPDIFVFVGSIKNIMRINDFAFLSIGYANRGSRAHASLILSRRPSRCCRL
jgi:hypothetical protein